MYNEKTFNNKETHYIIKTLSGSIRNKYENYVVNAIWNRIKSKHIMPVRQQYVNNEYKTIEDDRNHFFIDLYFPAIQLGIECDEPYHESNEEKDKSREALIYDIIHSLKGNFICKRVKIKNDSNIDDIDRQINEIVKMIDELAENVESDWSNLNPEKSLENRSFISTADNLLFDTICETCNTLFATDYISLRHISKPKTFASDKRFDDLVVWFPHLTTSEKKRWNNTLSKDGRYITEYSKKIKGHNKNPQTKIVFAKDKNPLGTEGYMFVGIFKQISTEPEFIDGYYTWKYEKISDECPIIRK